MRQPLTPRTLCYRHFWRPNGRPLTVRVYFPDGKPGAVTIDGAAAERYEYDEAMHVVSFALPASEDFRVGEVMMRK